MTNFILRLYRLVRFGFMEIWAKLSPLGYAPAHGAVMGENITFLWPPARKPRF
jgi:hypothetical protein